MNTENREQVPSMEGVFEEASRNTLALNPLVGIRGQDLVDSAGARLVAARMPRGRYVEAPGAYHEVLQETDAIRAVFWREFDALAGEVAP